MFKDRQKMIPYKSGGSRCLVSLTLVTCAKLAHGSGRMEKMSVQLLIYKDWLKPFKDIDLHARQCVYNVQDI